jgi:hypothetical protein
MYLPKCASDSPTRRNHYRKTVIITLSICGGFLFLATVLYILNHRYLRKRVQSNPQFVAIVKSQYKNVSYNHLFRATQGFSSENVIGRGSFGVVYKANMVLENVTTVAVKVLDLEQYGALRSIRH